MHLLLCNRLHLLLKAKEPHYQTINPYSTIFAYK